MAVFDSGVETGGSGGSMNRGPRAELLGASSSGATKNLCKIIIIVLYVTMFA